MKNIMTYINDAAAARIVSGELKQMGLNELSIGPPSEADLAANFLETKRDAASSADAAVILTARIDFPAAAVIASAMAELAEGRIQTVVLATGEPDVAQMILDTGLTYSAWDQGTLVDIGMLSLVDWQDASRDPKLLVRRLYETHR